MSIRHISQHVLAATMAAALLALTGCATNATHTQPATLAAAAQQEADLSTFNALVEQAGLKDALTGNTPVTVFAPSNEAFKALPSAALESLSKNPTELQAVLKHHIVPGTHTQASIGGATLMSTIGDTKLPVSKAGDFLTVEQGLVVKGDVQTGNGVLHIIDAVALPPKKK